MSLEPRIKVIFAGTKKTFMPLKPYGLNAYLNGISIVEPRVGELFWKGYVNNNDSVVSSIIDEIESPFTRLSTALFVLTPTPLPPRFIGGGHSW